MTVISSTKDAEKLTLELVSEFDASVERVWQVWEDPRQLERWWGPPTWPAKFQRFEFVMDGEVRYFMTGPDGTKAYGWWKITDVDPTGRLEFDDGFAGDDGEPSGFLGVTHCIVTLDGDDKKTRMKMVSSFVSLEQLEEMAHMGMEEGMREALGQIDAILAEQKVE